MSGTRMNKQLFMDQYEAIYVSTHPTSSTHDFELPVTELARVLAGRVVWIRLRVGNILLESAAEFRQVALQKTVATFPAIAVAHPPGRRSWPITILRQCLLIQCHEVGALYAHPITLRMTKIPCVALVLTPAQVGAARFSVHQNVTWQMSTQKWGIEFWEILLRQALFRWSDAD